MKEYQNGKVVQWTALLVLSLGILLGLVLFSNREVQPWNHMQLIGINGQQITSIWAGQSGNQKFARLLRALPALAKARMADSKLMTPFQVHASSVQPCAAVKAAVMKVAQSTPSSIAMNGPLCFMCFAQAQTFRCTMDCNTGGLYQEFFNDGMVNCHGVDFPDLPGYCGGCEEFQEECFNLGCDDC